MSIPSSPALRTVLLVDDKDTDRVATKWFLANFGFAVDVALSAEEALALFDPAVHDVVVTENVMAGMTGVEMAHIIKLRSSTTPVIMFTAVPPEDRSCLDCVIQRPIHLLALKEALDKLLTTKLNSVHQTENLGNFMVAGGGVLEYDTNGMRNSPSIASWVIKRLKQPLTEVRHADPRLPFASIGPT